MSHTFSFSYVRIIYAKALNDDGKTGMVIAIGERLYGGVCWLREFDITIGPSGVPDISKMTHIWQWIHHIGTWEDFVRDAEAHQWEAPKQLEPPNLVIEGRYE